MPQNVWDLPQLWEESFSRLYEELGLLPGNLAPRQQEHLVHLASWMPFAHAPQMLERLLEVHVSEETVRRLTEKQGRLWKWRKQHKSRRLAGGAESRGGTFSSRHQRRWGLRSPTQRRVGRSPHGALGEVEQQGTADGKQEVHVDLRRSLAVRILVFPHAAGHAAAMLQALEKAGLAFPSDLLQQCLHVLKHRGPRLLLGMLSRLPHQRQSFPPYPHRF
jgi:hypothetical protein